jgi:hypothetical protein
MDFRRLAGSPANSDERGWVRMVGAEKDAHLLLIDHVVLPVHIIHVILARRTRSLCGLVRWSAPPKL